MRKKNSTSDFTNHRSEALLRNFRESIARQSQISVIKAFREAGEAPAPRFWVSEARATRIITMLYKGVDLTTGMNLEKRRMYREIYRRVEEIRRQFPEKPIGDAIFDVVNSPAPCSYISWQSAKRIINRERRKRVKQIENSLKNSSAGYETA